MDQFHKTLPNFDSMFASMEEVLQSNSGFYETILQRSVFRRIGTDQIEHGITVIKGRHISEPAVQDRVLDYGELVLIQECLDRDTFPTASERFASWLIPRSRLFLQRRSACWYQGKHRRQ